METACSVPFISWLTTYTLRVEDDGYDGPVYDGSDADATADGYGDTLVARKEDGRDE